MSLKIAVYYRVSTDMQQTESQQSEVKDYIEQHYPDAEVVVFEDLAVSGATTKRKGYQAMLQAVSTRAVDVVVTYALDRVSRNSSEALRTILIWRHAGVRFVPISQPHLSTDTEGPFQNTILAAQADLAELERKGIVNRIKAGIKAKRAKTDGEWGGNRKVTEEQEAAIVVLRERGATIREIASRLELPKSTIHNKLKQL